MKHTLNFINMKNISDSKTPAKDLKRQQTELEKIFTSHISYKDPGPRIYK